MESLGKLAETGILHENAWAAAPFTAASFPSILSGKYRWSVTENKEGLEDSRPYLPEILSNHGYETAGFHSNANLHGELGWDRGMDVFFSGSFENRTNGNEANEESGIFADVKKVIAENRYTRTVAKSIWETTRSRLGIDLRGKPYIPAEPLQEHALEWVEDSKSPLFLWVHYMDVHTPWYSVDPVTSDVSDRKLLKLYHKAEENPDQLIEDEIEILRKAYQGSINNSALHVEVGA